MTVPSIRTADALMQSGRHNEAIEMLKRLIVLFPTYAMAHVLLAETYEQVGDDAAAIKVWRHAHSLVPNSPVVRKGLYRKRNSNNTPPVSREAQVTEQVEQQSVTQRPAAQKVVVEEDEAQEAEFKGIQYAPSNPALEIAHRAGNPPADKNDPVLNDLENLIDELAVAPRFESMPGFINDNNAPDETSEPEDGMVSETLARIYAAQRQYVESAETYEQLAEQHPERSVTFLRMAERMYARAEQRR